MAFLECESRIGRRVLLTDSVVHGLRTLAIRGFVALRRRGMEVGGMLLGNAAGEMVRIDGFVEVPCEHRYGPSFTLSEADEAERGHLVAVNAGNVVGIFRSFTSRDPMVADGDETFVRDHFPHGEFVCLLLNPLSAEECVATVRFFRDGQLLPKSGEPSFGFDARRMGVVEAPEEGVTQVPREEMAAAPAPVLPTPFRQTEACAEPGPPAQEPARRPARWWIPVIACLLLGILGGGIYSWRSLYHTPRWEPIGLDASPDGARLVFTWDTNASPVRAAASGRLNVTGGGVSRDIGLDVGQIHAGKYIYTPAHDNMLLRLTLDGPYGAVSEAVRLRTVTAANAPNPAQSAPAGEADRSASPPPAPSPSNVAAPPAVVREVRPRIPEGIRARIDLPIVIPVEVEVNSQGRVVHASANKQTGDSLHRYLAEQAEKTARQWRFRPGRTKSGARVASNKTIQFVFTH